MLYNLKTVFNDLNFRFQTIILPSFCLINVIFINLNIFIIAKNAVQNSIKLKYKIVNHHNNFQN